MILIFALDRKIGRDNIRPTCRSDIKSEDTPELIYGKIKEAEPFSWRFLVYLKNISEHLTGILTARLRGHGRDARQDPFLKETLFMRGIHV